MYIQVNQALRDLALVTLASTADDLDEDLADDPTPVAVVPEVLRLLYTLM